MKLIDDTGTRLCDSLGSLHCSCQEMIALEREGQRILQLPAERFLDGIPEELLELEKCKTALRDKIDSQSSEVAILREEWQSRGEEDDESATRMEQLEQQVKISLHSLQRFHKEAETIVRLRMEMIAGNLHQVEQSRRLLQAALQSVAA